MGRMSSAYTSSEHSSYINMPRYVRFTSPGNAWLVVWDDWKVWWDSSYSASKERSKWEVIPAGYRGGYTWYKIKSAYSGNVGPFLTKVERQLANALLSTSASSPYTTLKWQRAVRLPL
jgi:hypothetical protein